MLHGDEIAAAIHYQDNVYIFTRLGKVFKMWMSYTDRKPTFELIFTFN